MVRSVPDEVIERTLKGVAIPARPQVLVQLDKELGRPDPDPRVVTRLISSDVSLAAAVLKTINSPFFGLSRRMSSLDQAVSMLGLRATGQIVTGLVLRNTFGTKEARLDRFWDTAQNVAGISRHIASLIPRGPKEDTYCFGLFRDVGIPILLQKFPDYGQTLLLADGTTERPFTAVEEERHSTDHATIGYMVARGWFLPAAICEGILRHHDPSAFEENDPVNSLALLLIAINALAEHLVDEYIRMRSNSGWGLIGEKAMTHLGFGEDDYRDLREELVELIA